MLFGSGGAAPFNHKHKREMDNDEQFAQQVENLSEQHKEEMLLFLQGLQQNITRAQSATSSLGVFQQLTEGETT